MRLPFAAARAVLTEQDIYLFREGTHFRAYEKLGAHLVNGRESRRALHARENGDCGHPFRRVGAQRLTRLGRGRLQRLAPRCAPACSRARTPPESGPTFVPGVGHGALYKYHIESRNQGYTVQKSGPVRRATASGRHAPLQWSGTSRTTGATPTGCSTRAQRNALDAPWSMYEVHLGSWRRVPDEHNRSLNYRELAHAARPTTCATWASRTWSSCR